jgi:GPH family glycoside/pentoside/hexuronide:cation symporter
LLGANRWRRATISAIHVDQGRHAASAINTIRGRRREDSVDRATALIAESPSSGPSHAERSAVSLPLKLAYGVGEAASSIRMALLGLFSVYFYTTVMGLPGTLVGLASGIGLIWDAVIDPVIGHASDRLNVRGGRRHVFMIAGAATMGLTFWSMFSPPTGLPMVALVGWFLAANLLVRLSSSAFSVPYLALGAELCTDYHERTLLTGVRGACALVGSLVAVGLVFPVFFPSSGTGEEARVSYHAYPLMGLAFGAVMSLVALIAPVATFGRGAPRREGPSAASGRPAPAGLAAATLSTLRHRSFRLLFLSTSLIFLALVISSAIALHFFTLFAGIADSSRLGVLQVALYGGSVIGVPIWIVVSRRSQKHRLYQAVAVVTGAVVVSAFFLVGEGRPFGTGDSRPLFVGQLLAGILTSAFWILPWSMLADIVDADALTAGTRREGVYFGMLSLGQQLATGVSVFAIGLLIDHFAGLIPGQPEQSPLTVERIGMLFSLLPAGLLLVSAALMHGYRLDRATVAAIQTALADGATLSDSPARRPRDDDRASLSHSSRLPTATPAGSVARRV